MMVGDQPSGSSSSGSSHGMDTKSYTGPSSGVASASGHAGIGSAGLMGKPSLQGFSRERDGKRYSLYVAQSPSRARMCGFGDKDRRPLSPILIVRLDVTDTRTGKAIPPSSIDTSAYFLAADLVHPEDLKASPRNLLVHHHAASVAADALTAPRGSGLDGGYIEPSGMAAFDGETGGSRSDSTYYQSPGSGAPPPFYHQNHSHQQHPSVPSPQSSSYSSNSSYPPPPPNYTTVTTETYTRNFVGALVASANVLRDEKNDWGIFFILSDLSVRTEGIYRIKIMFANLADSASGEMQLGASEALAEAYTDPFTVYTPRRFPGVIEPTSLSRKFAAQGIKIPVRVDRKRRRVDGHHDGDDENGEEDGEVEGERSNGFDRDDEGEDG